MTPEEYVTLFVGVVCIVLLGVVVFTGSWIMLGITIYVWRMMMNMLKPLSSRGSSVVEQSENY